ncbi:MAG: beta-propeller fold lactonase family protein, partial [Spirochaetales bacterium]|nr:beta-propeller fold lactonase family protein [Spirochaetales bacterium]
IVYVADFGSGAVLMYDAYSLDRVGELDDGVSAKGGRSAKRHLVVDPVRGRLYASDMARASVFAWDLASGRLIAEVWLGARANTNTIQVSADGRWLYASTRGPNNAVDYERKGPAFGELVVLDTGTMSIAERHWGGNQPTGLALSPDGRTVVFSDFLDHRVEIYRRSD